MIKEEHVMSAQALGTAIARAIQQRVNRHSKDFANPCTELWTMQISMIENALDNGAKTGVDVLGILATHGYVHLPLPTEAQLFANALVAGEYTAKEHNYYSRLITGLVTAGSVNVAQ